MWVFWSMGSSQSAIKQAAELISRWDDDDLKERLIFDSSRKEINQYFEASDKIIQFSQRDELKEFIPMIITRFKYEFRTVLTRQTESAMGSSSINELSISISDTSSLQFRYEDYVLYDIPKQYIVDYLQRIVVRTNDCGQLKVLIELYMSVRKEFVDRVIKKLRFKEFLTGKTNRFLGEDLKMKTERWVQAAKICFKLLLPREKLIAKQIFGRIGDSIADEYFMQIVKDVIFNLLRLPENIISSNLSSEKLEIVLILCNALLSLEQDFNSLFQFESGQRARITLESLISGLQNEVRRMLSDYINAVFHDASKVVEKSESVLHFTKYVMGYLNILVNHKTLLMNVIVSKPSSLNVPDYVFQEFGNLSPLSFHLVLIIAVLILNLDAKCKKHKNENPIFGCVLFMMNNLQFIVKEVTGSSSLQEIIGSDYLNKLKNDLNNTMDQFQALACDDLLDCLKEEDLYESSCFCRGGVSTRTLKKQIMKFNSLCEDMYVVQSSRIITDTSIREELCRSTKKKLVPAYKRFLEKFKKHLENENNSKSSKGSFGKVSIKYSVEDLDDLVMKGYQLSSSREFHVESS